MVDTVVGLGGAVGWHDPPGPAAVTTWLDGWRTGVAAGRAGMVLARVDGALLGIGGWRSAPAGPVGHVAELCKIMLVPEGRGLGLGRVIVDALVEAAAGAGAEVLTLGVRGNNHGAVALYESAGFAVWGVLPDGVAVGDERFDDVRMYRTLPRPDAVLSRGRTAGGPGGSYRRGAPSGS